MINALRASSRSVSNNIYYDRMQEKDRKIHLQRLKQIQGDSHGDLKNIQHKARLKQLKKNKSASHKMDQVFDPTRLQNKALVTHITEIKKRKSEHGLSLKQINTHRSAKEDEREQIKRQNKKLIMAILEQKSRITNKRDLKKQFKAYEEQRDKLRKVKSKSQL